MHFCARLLVKTPTNEMYRRIKLILFQQISPQNFRVLEAIKEERNFPK
jgi:hypothetical protein